MNNGLGFFLCVYIYIYIYILSISLCSKCLGLIGHFLQHFIIRPETKKRWKDRIRNRVLCDNHRIEISTTHTWSRD